MRKQTKLVAVLSAAALLAMGASMTSFAAGWQKDDAGVWHYYDKDDELVTGEWKKDGGKWFYLDDDGDMAVDQWVEDEYYVAEDGHMLTNEWIKTLSDEDQDEPEDDGEHWYYFGSKGKRTTGSKKINGKNYYFDTDGKMYHGWHNEGTNVYYLGDEDDGARTNSSWLWLAAPDVDDSDESAAANALNHSNADADPCDEEGWYWFGSDGKMYKEAGQKKINGRYYFFNNHGQMLYEWINGVKSTMASNAKLDGNVSATASEVRYMNVVEEGWRADGWYQIDGAEALGTDEDTDWYYFKDGKAKRADEGDKNRTGLDDGGSAVLTKKIKVNGKNFCFNEKGQMQTGLQLISGKMYYFDENGYMQTGKVSNVEEENDSFTYYFDTKNGKLGQGYTGVKSGYLYWNGKRLEADDDYRIFVVDQKEYVVNNKGKVQKSTTKNFAIEGSDNEMKFTFNDNNSISTATDTDGNTTSYSSYVTTPRIELYDSVIYEDANGDPQIFNPDRNARGEITKSAMDKFNELH